MRVHILLVVLVFWCIFYVLCRTYVFLMCSMFMDTCLFCLLSHRAVLIKFIDLRNLFFLNRAVLNTLRQICRKLLISIKSLKAFWNIHAYFLLAFKSNRYKFEYETEVNIFEMRFKAKPFVISRAKIIFEQF